jgi:hypothetical protein
MYVLGEIIDFSSLYTFFVGVLTFLPLKNFWNTDREKRDYRNLGRRIEMSTLFSREASDAGQFHLKTKSRDFRVIFYEK